MSSGVDLKLPLYLAWQQLWFQMNRYLLNPNIVQSGQFRKSAHVVGYRDRSKMLSESEHIPGKLIKNPADVRRLDHGKNDSSFYPTYRLI